MNLTQEQKLFIKESFSKMKSKEDFLALLNYSKSIIYGDKSFRFYLKQISYHANPRLNNNRYTSFTVKKKSGALRTISAPNNGLKEIQKCLNLIFQAIYDLHPAAKGFVPGKSIVDNAVVHAGNYYVYNIDLKDFFPSIDQARVWGRLKHPPFNLNEENDRLGLANIIASLCCHEMEVERLDANNQWQKIKRNVLPQGAPTSPTLSNIICQQMDFYLTATAKRFGLKYSRYADDITFSSLISVFSKEGEFLNELERIIKDQGFYINESKTRLQKQGHRQEVTGLLVNEKPNVQKRYIKQLRMWLYYWEQYGYEKASKYFLSKYVADKGPAVKGNPEMNNVIVGKLDYLKMVKGGDNKLYLKLLNRLYALQKQEKIIEYDSSDITKTSELSSNQKLIKLNLSSKTLSENKYSVSAQKATERIAAITDKESLDNKSAISWHSKSLIKHDPLMVMRFLKNFKYDNDTGLKELVHKPFDMDSFDFNKILEKIYSLPNFSIKKSKETRIFAEKLPVQIWKGTTELIEFLSTTGKDYYDKTQKHPLEDPLIAKKIQKFKRDYRFGSERTEYSILRELIINIIKDKELRHDDADKSIIYSFSEVDTSTQFSLSQISILPDDLKFTLRAGFFTWVPNVKNALWWIFDNILKHSNLYGNRDFSKADKKIEISIERIKETPSDPTKVILSICDSHSVLTKSPESLLQDLKGSAPFTNQLRSIADWSVECDYERKSYRFLMLPKEGVLEEIKSPVNGFKHIITFYD